jgi:hypothetical protein
MLSDDKRSFTPLVGEQQLYSSPPRTSLSVNTKYTSGTDSDNFSVESGAGMVFLTNRRVCHFKSNDLSENLIFVHIDPIPSSKPVSQIRIFCHSDS